MKTPYLIALACGISVALAAVLIPSSPRQNFGAKAVNPAGGPATPATAYQEISWDELVPKDWDPLAQFKKRNAAALPDSSPQAASLMQEMRAVWDNAPTVDAMHGRKVRLPGYVVPLEATAGALKEFLLVPYFGACIHTPPPPANQIVHVITDKPVKGFGAMAAVWLTGTLTIGRNQSDMGASGYQLRLQSIEAYDTPRRP